MSYGFLAKQLPVELQLLTPCSQPGGNKHRPDKDYYTEKGHLYIVLELTSGKYCLRVPPVWVLSLRSGSDKTNINVEKDILLLGLVDGKMYLRTPKGMKLRADYRPSFDTKVILAHAVGNAIIASILERTGSLEHSGNEFSKRIKIGGAAIAHWHGYIRPDLIPRGWSVHGYNNPHVACSTAQSAIFALSGKLQSFKNLLGNDQEAYHGDVHIEPHHGTNITFTSIYDLATFLLESNASELGNKYLNGYEVYNSHSAS